jgi:hypothetical protein
MRAIILRQPAGLDQLEATTISDIGAPGPGQIAVRLKASSLNYHDYVVVTGATKTGDRRIPMSDGAGEVVAVGEGVTAFAPCDRVVSTFFINRLAGVPSRTVLSPAMESTAMHERPSSPLRRASAIPPRVMIIVRQPPSPVRASPLGARFCRWAAIGRTKRVGAGHWRRLDLRIAIRQGNGRDGHRHLLLGGKARTAVGDGC